MRYLLAALLFLAASAARAATEPPADTKATLIYYNLAGNQTLDPADPQNNSSYAHDALLAIYDTLIRLDNSGTPGPGLAQSWTRNADLTELTLKLRPGVMLHDGTRLTAEVVARNFERNTALGRKAGSSVAETMALIGRVEVQGADTIRLTLRKPTGQIEAWLGGTAGMIMSPAAFADGAASGTLKPIGSGPFKVTKFESNVRMITVRDDAYWGGIEGRPAGFEHHYVTDGRARLNAVRSGQATLVLLDSRQIPEARAAGLTVQVNEKNAFWVLYFNLQRAGLSDVRIRRAIMHAIDRDALAGALTFGSGRATEQIFAAASPLNIKALDDRYPYDPARAKALLTEAGKPNGVDINLLVLNNTEFRPLAEALQSMLAEAGIRVTFDTVDVSQYPLFFLPPPRGDMMLGRFGGRSEPVQMLRELVGTGGPYSPGGPASPQIDTLLNQAGLLAGNDPRHDQVLRELVNIVSDAVSLVPVMTRSNVYAFKPGCIRGLEPYLPGGADRFNDVRVGQTCH